MQQAEGLLKQLGEHLQAEDGSHAYLLLDPMMHDPLGCEMLLAESCEAIKIDVRRPGLLAEQCPKLIQLRPQAVAVLRTSIESALSEQQYVQQEATDGFAVGAWLLSSSSHDKVSRHLENVMCLPQPGSGRRYFRWADRRVMEWMWPELTDAQCASLLGPIHSWTSIDRRGELTFRNGADMKEERSNEVVPPLRLTAAQWNHAGRCEVGQHLLRGWRRFSSSLPADYLPRAINAVSSVASLGVKGMQDTVLLGAYVLQVHPRLCDHPRLQELVAGAQSGGMELSRALEGVHDPEGWNAMRDELERSPVFNLQAE